MGLTRISLAKALGTALILLGMSNVAFAAADHVPVAYALGPAVLVGGLGAVVWWWALRAPRASSREGPNTIWVATAKIVGTISLLYGLGILLLFAAVGRASLAADSAVVFGGFGIALWVWAIYTGWTISARTSSTGTGDLPTPPPPLAAPLRPAGGSSLAPSVVDLSTAYRDVDREGTDAFALARTLAQRMIYAHVVIVVVTLGFPIVTLLLFPRTDLWDFLAPIGIAFYFGFSAWSLARRYGWVDQELRAGRIPSEADLGRGLLRMIPLPAPAAGSAPPTVDAIAEERSVVARTLAMLQFGRHMARDSRQLAWVLLVFVFVFGSLGAWVVTFATLMEFAGGTANIARDAGAAWAAAGITAAVVFALLYRVYSRIDRLDRRFRSLESTTAALERAFWSRY